MIKLVLTFFIVFQSSIFADINLPSIGQGSHYQLQKEKEIGDRFHYRLLQANRIINDPMVNFYLKEVSSILLQSLDENYRSFTVALINDPAINAFAVPGGFIGINYGLVMAAQTEAQLAGVLAHEISHIVLNHLSQLLEKQGSSTSVIAASLLLALVVSQSVDSDSKGEAVQALIIGGTAGAQQALINFTRENEYEADRKGLELMKKSGYPAVGMAEFFSILGGEGSSGELASIEYLRTHPVSSNRMGEAYQFNSRKLFDQVDESIEYEFFKVYLNSVVGGDYKLHSKNKEVQLYKRALDAAKLNQFDRAIDILQIMSLSDTDNLWVAYKLMDLYTQQNLYKKALGIINQTLELYPQQSLLLSQKIKVLMLLKRYKAAQILALHELKKNDDNQSIRYVLVTIYEYLGQRFKAKEMEGDFMLKQGYLMRAKYLYQQVLGEVIDSNTKKGIQEKIEKVERLEKLEKEL